MTEMRPFFSGECGGLAKWQRPARERFLTDLAAVLHERLNGVPCTFWCEKQGLGLYMMFAEPLEPEPPAVDLWVLPAHYESMKEAGFDVSRVGVIGECPTTDATTAEASAASPSKRSRPSKRRAAKARPKSGRSPGPKPRSGRQQTASGRPRSRAARSRGRASGRERPAPAS